MKRVIDLTVISKETGDMDVLIDYLSYRYDVEIVENFEMVQEGQSHRKRRIVALLKDKEEIA